MSPEAYSVIQALKKAIRASMNELSDKISTGGCADWAEYNKMTGVILGLATAERELLDLLERAEKAE